MTNSERSWTASNSLLCVGLDPDPARFPTALDGARRRVPVLQGDRRRHRRPRLRVQAPDRLLRSQREEAALERMCTYILETYPDVTLILDAKRGDIGSTAEHYAREAFERYRAHAVTVNPYLGADSVVPFFAHGGGVIALCRTSNPGGDDLQSLDVGGKPLYVRVAEMVADDWAQHGDCGLVVGATYPDELREVRASSAISRSWFPASAHQGGDPQAAVDAGATDDGRGLMISSSRAILYASARRRLRSARPRRPPSRPDSPRFPTGW